MGIHQRPSDGRLLAYTQGREVVVRELRGDEVRSLGLAPSQVRYVTWHPDNRRLLVHERSFDRRRQGWFLYDVVSGAKEALWANGYGAALPPRDALLELVWTPDGASVVGVVRGSEGSRVWRIGAAGDSGEINRGGWQALPPGRLSGRRGSLHRARTGRAVPQVSLRGGSRPMARRA